MLSTQPPRGRPRSSGANSGTSLVFAPISRSAITAESEWVAAASRYGICPSAPIAPLTASGVDGQRGQQRRAGHGSSDRPEPGLAAQVGTQLVSQPLGAQGGKDPLDGVRMRRGVPAAVVAPHAQGTQQLRVRVSDPVGDLD